MNYADVLALEPFSVPQKEKERLYSDGMRALTRFHAEHCAAYRGILEAMGYDEYTLHAMDDIPFLPVRIFKELELMSVKREEIFKTMTSSGTTGQIVSKIFLDKDFRQPAKSHGEDRVGFYGFFPHANDYHRLSVCD